MEKPDDRRSPPKINKPEVADDHRSLLEEEELIFYLLQFLKEKNFIETLHKLEEESAVFFCLEYFKDCIVKGEFKKAIYYLHGFTNSEKNPVSEEMIFQIICQYFLEALDRNDKGLAWIALSLIKKNLSHGSEREEIFEKYGRLFRLSNPREDDWFRSFGTQISASRQDLADKVSAMAEKNPNLLKKLVFPKLSSGLREFIKKRSPPPPVHTPMAPPPPPLQITPPPARAITPSLLLYPKEQELHDIRFLEMTNEDEVDRNFEHNSCYG